MGKTIEGTTRSGFRFSVAANAAEDMELLDDMAALQDGSDPFALSRGLPEDSGEGAAEDGSTTISGERMAVCRRKRSPMSWWTYLADWEQRGKNSEPSPE